VRERRKKRTNVKGGPCVLCCGAGHQQQWALPFVGAGQVRPPSQQAPPDRKGHSGGGVMDSGSRSSGGARFDDEDSLTTRREVSSSLQDTSIPLNLCEIHSPLLLLTPANDVKTRSLSRLLTISTWIMEVPREMVQMYRVASLRAAI
jgi:hypothetical protein